MNDGYIHFILGTISGYPDKYCRYLMNMLLNGVLKEKGFSSINDFVLQYDGLQNKDCTSKDIITAIFNTFTDSSVNVFERWEYIKDYKYSVLFSVDDYDASKVLLTQNSITQYGESGYSESQHSDNFERPYIYTSGTKLFAKFVKMLSSIQNATIEEQIIKYPLIVVFHDEYKLVEFRFDSIKRIFLTGADLDESSIYSDQISGIQKILESYGIILHGLDLEFVTSFRNTKNDVKVIGDYRKLPNGGNAQLEVGNNVDYVFPIIGELKEILKEHQAELDSVPCLKSALEEFIYNNDELADYTWVEVIWPKTTKAKSIHVKFILNYKNECYSLIQHYSSCNLVGMERMDYVTEYISKNRDDN